VPPRPRGAKAQACRVQQDRSAAGVDGVPRLPVRLVRRFGIQLAGEGKHGLAGLADAAAQGRQPRQPDGARTLLPALPGLSGLSGCAVTPGMCT